MQDECTIPLCEIPEGEVPSFCTFAGCQNAQGTYTCQVGFIRKPDVVYNRTTGSLQSPRGNPCFLKKPWVDGQSAGKLVATMHLDNVNSTVMDDPVARKSFLDNLKAELSVSMNVSTDLIEIINIRFEDKNKTDDYRRLLQEARMYFEVTVTGDVATERLEDLKLNLAEIQDSLKSDVTARGGSIIMELNVESQMAFVCPAGKVLDLDKGVCVMCPYPEYTPDELECVSCPDSEREVPNSKGTGCECVAGKFDSFEGGASSTRVVPHCRVLIPTAAC